MRCKEMSGRYVYFRPGDQPSLEFEKIDKLEQLRPERSGLAA